MREFNGKVKGKKIEKYKNNITRILYFAMLIGTLIGLSIVYGNTAINYGIIINRAKQVRNGNYTCEITSNTDVSVDKVILTLNGVKGASRIVSYSFDGLIFSDRNTIELNTNGKVKGYIKYENGRVTNCSITVKNINSASAPTITGGNTENTYYSENHIVSLLTPGTATSGVKNYEYYTSSVLEELDENTIPKGVTDGEFEVNENGLTYVWYRTVANDMIKSKWSNYVSVYVDKLIPKVSIDVKNIKNKVKLSNDIWSTDEVEVSFMPDNVGPSGYKILYCVTTSKKCNPDQIYTKPFRILEDGIYDVYYKIIPGYDLEYEPQIDSFRIKIDKIMPEVQLTAVKENSDEHVLSGMWSDKNLDIKINPVVFGISEYTIYYCIDDVDACNPSIFDEKRQSLNYIYSEENNQYIRYKIVGDNGLESAVFSYNMRVDKTNPVCSFDGESTLWGKTRVITSSCRDNLSGCRDSITDKIWSYNTGTIRTDVLSYSIEDNAGNRAICSKNANIFVDNEKSNTYFETNGNSVYSKNQSTRVAVEDVNNGSGVKYNSLKYQWTQSTQTPTESSFTTSFNNGDTITKDTVNGNNWYLWIYAEDNVGNKSITRSNAFYLDNEMPTVTFGTNGNTTYAKTQSTTVTVFDHYSGVKTLKYQWTQSTTAPAANTFTTTFNNGANITKNTGTGNNWYLWIYAEDNVGNMSITRSNAFYLDNIAPTCNWSGENTEWRNTKVTISITCSDNLSGCTSDTASKNIIYDTGTITTDTISHTIRDKAGNSTICSKTVNVFMDKEPPVVTGTSFTNLMADSYKLNVNAYDNGSGISNYQGVVNIDGTDLLYTSAEGKSHIRMRTFDNEIRLLVNDKAGNQSETYVTFNARKEYITQIYKAILGRESIGDSVWNYYNNPFVYEYDIIHDVFNSPEAQNISLAGKTNYEKIESLYNGIFGRPFNNAGNSDDAADGIVINDTIGEDWADYLEVGNSCSISDMIWDVLFLAGPDREPKKLFNFYGFNYPEHEGSSSSCKDEIIQYRQDHN